MSESSAIQVVAHAKIDRAKWDRCIDRADNGLIYGYSFYLDHMARHWDALVWKDYEAVMPLTWNRKWGISYLYQPFLTAQLGVFGKNISAGLLKSFLDSVPGRFRYWDIYLNHGNYFSLDEFNLYRRSNYVLSLNRSYADLAAGYRENITRNIRKAGQAGCYPDKGFDAEKVIGLALQQMRSHGKDTTDHVDRFRKLYAFLQRQGRATTYGIRSAKKELLASCVFFFSHQRAYYILVGNHPDGRTIGASHALIDYFIRDNAEKNLLLDFEGSDIRNLAFFYSSFGAREELFAGLRVNRLPFLLRYFKK